MATRYTKPVTRAYDTSLNATGFREGFIARQTREGVEIKPPRVPWRKAYFASWGDILIAGAARAAEHEKKARAEARAARKAGL